MNKNYWDDDLARNILKVVLTFEKAHHISELEKTSLFIRKDPNKLLMHVKKLKENNLIIFDENFFISGITKSGKQALINDEKIFK